jgi:hypothetical protein
MTLIYDLAPEPLIEIISFLKIDELYALWSTGDGGVHHRLSEGGVVRDLAIPCSALWKPAWLSLLHQVSGHLESFSLFTNDSMYVYAKPRDAEAELRSKMARRLSGCMSLLPKRLKTLDLTGNACPFVVAQDLLKPSHFPNIHTLKLNVGQGVTSSADSLSFLPKTLTDLDLGVDGNLNPSYLPQSVTKLSLRLSELEIAADGPSNFPSGLLWLSLTSQSHVPFFHLIPTTCGYLSYESHTFDGVALDESKLKPLSSLQLTYLRIFCRHYRAARDLIANPSISQYFPRTLQSLDFELEHERDWLVSFFGKLPPGLTHLGGGYEFSMWSISTEIAKLLPRGLKGSIIVEDLEVLPLLPATIGMVTILNPSTDLSAIETFPACLKHLYISELPVSVARLVPSSLTKLEVGDTEYAGYLVVTEEAIAALPRTLLSLSLPHGPLECCKALPPKLTSLRIGYSRTWKGDRKDLVRVPSEFVQWLPRHLTSLALSDLTFKSGEVAKWASGLPPYLISLEFGIAIKNDGEGEGEGDGDEDEDGDGGGDGPPTGLSGIFSHLKYLEVLVVMLNTNPPKEEWPSLLKNLPPNLILLDLMGEGTVKLTNEDFKHLPKSINYLSLRFEWDGEVNKGCLEYLPNIVMIFEDDENHHPEWFEDWHDYPCKRRYDEIQFGQSAQTVLHQKWSDDD